MLALWLLHLFNKTSTPSGGFRPGSLSPFLSMLLAGPPFLGPGSGRSAVPSVTLLLHLFNREVPQLVLPAQCDRATGRALGLFFVRNGT